MKTLTEWAVGIAIFVGGFFAHYYRLLTGKGKVS
jgi:hypothetical protein